MVQRRTRRARAVQQAWQSVPGLLQRSLCLSADDRRKLNIYTRLLSRDWLLSSVTACLDGVVNIWNTWVPIEVSVFFPHEVLEEWTTQTSYNMGLEAERAALEKVETQNTHQEQVTTYITQNQDVKGYFS